MRWVNHSVYTLLFVLTLLASLVVSPGTASATSPYDATVRYTQELTVKRNPFARVDVSTGYASLIQEFCAPEYYSSLEATVSAEGEYSITKAERGATESRPNDQYVFVTWSQNGSGSMAFQTEFTTYKSLYHVRGSGISYKSAQIYMDSSGNLGVACNNGIPAAYASTNKPGLASWDFTVWVATFDMTYPSGYEGELLPSEPPSAKYVAMGDSFSGGEGNPSFEYGTDQDDVDECHRSPEAYPRLLQNDPNLGLGSTAFVACSGATTQNVLYGGSGNGAWGEPPQIDALSDDTEIVTITVGGNDIGFGDFGYECLFPVNLTHGTCDEFTDIYEDTVWKISNELPDKLENVYGILLANAENADIYVLGYPNIAPYKDIGDPFDQDCGGLYDEFPNNWGDARAAHEVTGLLNGAIEDAVNAVNIQYMSSRLIFVPVDSGAFAGHDACSSDSYFNGIVLPDTEYSVHPNADGHAAYKEDLSDVMS